MATSDFSPAVLRQLDVERLRGYRELLEFYRGSQWPGRPKAGERRLTFNYARVVVDKVTSYLMAGRSFMVEPGGDGPGALEQARRAEEALYRVHRENQIEQLDFETEVDCAVLGDACYKVTWDPAAQSVRITSPDVQGIFAWRVGDDPARLWRLASRYTLDAAEAERLYGIRPPGRQVVATEVWTGERFQLWLDNGLQEDRPNPYGFIPFVLVPNLREPKRFWGVSDLEAIMEAQREFNRAMSQLSAILELSGNPIAVLENVEESEDIAVRPGAVWNIPEDARAYLLDLLQGGGLRLHIDYINQLYRTLHDVSEAPRAAFGGTERDLSGVALEMEMQPLMQKVMRKRLIRTAAYNRRCRMVLDLLARFRGEDFGQSRVSVSWGPLLPRDAARLVSSEQVLVQGGIHSRRRAMAELGVRDPEAEFRRWLEERRAILEMNRELATRPARSGARERVAEAGAGVGDE